MTSVVKNWKDLFTVYIDCRTRNITEEVKDFVITYFEKDMYINFTAEFKFPYLLGLLNKKKDYLVIALKNNTDPGMIILNTTANIFGVNTTQFSIPMQFDYRNEKMQYMRNTAITLYYVMIGIVVLQFLMLFVRNVGLLPLWTLLEYMQLIAFMPIYNFKLIPYLYDAFKPFLVSHLILFNNSFFYKDLNTEYFNTNYKYYDLSIGKLIQSLMNLLILLVLIVLANLCVLMMSFCCRGNSRFGQFVSSRLSQFKFNVYLRYFMLIYFDFTFFSVLKI